MLFGNHRQRQAGDANQPHVDILDADFPNLQAAPDPQRPGGAGNVAFGGGAQMAGVEFNPDANRAKFGAELTGNTRDDMKIVQEEIFGPVVVATKFKDLDEDLLRRANDSVFGLAAGIWSTNVSTIHRVAARLEAGTVWANCYNIFDASLPFGGFKQSGWGREMGSAVLNNYLETKTVCIRL